MFARVTTVNVAVDKIDEATRVMQESVIPAAKSQKGFRGIYLLGDTKTGKSISISLWETEEDAIANEQSGYLQEQMGKLAPFFTGAPVQEGYEVIAQG